MLGENGSTPGLHSPEHGSRRAAFRGVDHAGSNASTKARGTPDHSCGVCNRIARLRAGPHPDCTLGSVQSSCTPPQISITPIAQARKIAIDCTRRPAPTAGYPLHTPERPFLRATPEQRDTPESPSPLCATTSTNSRIPLQEPPPREAPPKIPVQTSAPQKMPPDRKRPTPVNPRRKCVAPLFFWLGARSRFGGPCTYQERHR